VTSLIFTPNLFTPEFFRLQAALNITTDRPIRILERSLFSERYCFVENQRRMSKLADVEFVLADQWFQFINKHFQEQIKPDLIGKQI
jgi:hypothetical protein